MKLGWIKGLLNLSQSYDEFHYINQEKYLKDLDESDKIYAMDIHILMSLNQKYKNYKNKFRFLVLKMKILL